MSIFVRYEIIALSKRQLNQVRASTRNVAIEESEAFFYSAPSFPVRPPFVMQSSALCALSA